MNGKKWLTYVYNIGTLLTLFIIMAQVIIARRAMVQSSEWEKAKVTIENIKWFKENISKSALYDKTDLLVLSEGLLPDLSTPEGREASDTLRRIYLSLFDGDSNKWREDFDKTIGILNDFAYPIIMGYASEFGSYESVWRDFNRYGNYVIAGAFRNMFLPYTHVRLLYRLWRVKTEQIYISHLISMNFEGAMPIEKLGGGITLSYYEGTEVTLASVKQYEKKLQKELKQIQKEIEEFRKSSMK